MLEEDDLTAPCIVLWEAVEGEDVSVLSDHVVRLHGIAGLRHHPVSGLAVSLAMQGPGEQVIWVETSTLRGDTYAECGQDCVEEPKVSHSSFRLTTRLLLSTAHRGD